MPKRQKKENLVFHDDSQSNSSSYKYEKEHSTHESAVELNQSQILINKLNKKGIEKPRKARKSLFNTILNQYKRKVRNICPNLLKRLYKLCSDDQDIKRMILALSEADMLYILNTKTNKEELKVITKTKCCKTQCMKFLFLLRKGMLQNERMELTYKFQQIVQDSIERQTNAMTKDPKKRQECLEAIKQLQEMKTLISFFLLTSNYDYNLQINNIRRNVFFSADRSPKYNAGVETIQNARVEETQMEIPNFLDVGSWDDVFDFSQEPKYQGTIYAVGKYANLQNNKQIS